MTRYASQTTVSQEQSLQEIRRTLTRYKATKFGFIEDEAQVGVAFEMRGRRIRFVLPLPSLTDNDIQYTPERRRPRTNDSKLKALEQATNQRWRALGLVIKAKLESVEGGIETFEEAFMAQVVLPDGSTMSQWATTQIDAAYSTGTMPPLLPMG